MCCDKVGEAYKRFGKRPSPYYVKNSTNKQSETTTHHYFKTWRSVNRIFKDFSKFLQVQLQKPSSAMMNLALMRTATEMEDSELTLLQRIRSLELPGSEIAAQINASEDMHICRFG